MGPSRKSEPVVSVRSPAHRARTPGRSVRGSGHTILNSAAFPWALVSAVSGSCLLFERRRKCLHSQWSAGMLVGTQDFEVLFANDPGEEAAPLAGQLEQGSDPHQN